MQAITIMPRAGEHQGPQTVQGTRVLAQLGYATGYEKCLLDMPCATLRDLEVLGGWAVGAIALCYVVLRFCVRDPH